MPKATGGSSRGRKEKVVEILQLVAQVEEGKFGGLWSVAGGVKEKCCLLAEIGARDG